MLPPAPNASPSAAQTQTSTATGTLTVEGFSATMTFVRRLRHPIEAVWAALTDPAQRAAWFGVTTIEAHAGGRIVMDPADPPAPREMKRMTGRILTWDPPHVLEHEWVQQISGESVVRYELRADGDETVLTFTHRGLNAGTAKGFIPGTHAFLDRFQAHLDGVPLPGWQERYAEVAPAYGGSWG